MPPSLPTLIRRAAALAILAATTSCGGSGGDPSASVPVATVPAPTPSPAPSPAPSAMPSPAPTASPTTAPSPPVVPAQPPVATAAPVPVTLGTVTWSFYAEPPADRRQPITDAMNFAVNAINTVARYSGNIPVAYNAGVPTAQAGFERSIEFGGAISGRVALHETAHWFGSGTFSRWNDFMAGGRWTGAAGVARIRAYDGGSATLFGDRMHFWPYGWNHDPENVAPQRHVGLVAAMRRDMGLSDGMADSGGVYGIGNRTSMLLLDYESTGSDVRPVQRPPLAPSGQRWMLVPGDGFVTLRNLVTGLVLDSLGTTTDGAVAGVALPTGAAAQQWEMVPTDDGWFLLSNRATGRCLDTVGATNDTAPVRMWSCGGHPNQQWRLMRWP